MRRPRSFLIFNIFIIKTYTKKYINKLNSKPLDKNGNLQSKGIYA